MTHRERFIESLTFGRPDRYMLWQLFGLMPGVVDRWVSEGMPEPVDPAEPLAFFDLDPQPAALAVNTWAYPGFEPRVIEDNDEHTVAFDSLGRTTKLIKASASLPLPLAWPVKGPEDWERLKPMLRYDPARFAPDWLARYSAARRSDLPVVLSVSGFYDLPRLLMGDEALAYAYYDHPEMVSDIGETYTRMLISVVEEALARAQIDAVFLGEDMAYRGGMMISPEHFARFIRPYYDRMIAPARAAGVRIFSVDSDGDLRDLIPLMLAAGINAMRPFEVQAGNDIVALRRSSGASLAITGGLDKFCVTRGRAAIDRELAAKLPPMIACGGYIASLDHRVTIETPLADYQYYLQQARRYLGGT